MLRRILNVIARALRIAAPYWHGEERWRAFALLSVVVLLNLGLVGIAVLLTYWQRAFYNSLESRDWTAFISLLVSWNKSDDVGFIPGFGPILIVYVIFTVYSLYLQQALHIRWRSALTSNLLTKWFSGRAFYFLSVFNKGADNPDQRISEDADMFVDGALTLGLGLMTAIVSLLSFIVLLWTLSDSVQVFGLQFAGSLVWVAILYAVFGTFITHLLGRRLIPLNFAKQRAEADFRFALVRLRENAESVALYNGEKNEIKDLTGRFGNVVHNWRGIMAVTKRMTFFASGFSQAVLVFPLAIIAPAYFAGRITLGGIFQTANAFVKVQEALSWIVENYAKIAEWSATIQRLEGFVDHVDTIQDNESMQRRMLIGGDVLATSALTLKRPDGTVLLANVNVRVERGERVLLRGPSGVGKSTLLRAFAGLWPHHVGRIRTPEGFRVFIPQKAYMPTGALLRALTYPLDADVVGRTRAREVLETVGLEALADHLSDEDVWSAKLSGGEIQRVALARVILQMPDWLFLDEATSHLDPDAEAFFYNLILDRLPDISLVSIAHREQVEDFHTRVLRVEHGGLQEADLIHHDRSSRT